MLQIFDLVALRSDAEPNAAVFIGVTGLKNRCLPSAAVGGWPEAWAFRKLPHASTDQWLFDPGDLRAPQPERSLVIRSTRGRPLSKEERAFNRALARVQALTRALDDEKRRFDRLLVFHAAEVRPRVERAVALRTDLVRALERFLDDRRLTKGQRRALRQILVEQLDAVLLHVERPEPDLQDLFERLHHVSYAQALQEDLEEARVQMAAAFDELGLDVDVPELRADMTEEDAAAAAARLAHDLRRAEENRSGAGQIRVKTKRQLREEEKARTDEQLRKDSLGAVYRRLVKELHPDRERDPAERERKSRVMQDIPAAYTRGDLHALLQLELEFLDAAGAAADHLSREKLRAYAELLKQQATELQPEVQSLRLHPRYAPLMVDGPFGLPVVIDGPREVERLDATIEQIRAALDRLSSDQALTEVRGAIGE